MNDTHLTHFDHIADDTRAKHTEMQLNQRATRRAIAINAVVMARTHAGRHEEMFSPEDSDILVGIMNLLDKVAAT